MPFGIVRQNPPPFGGWDTRENIADMPADRAPLLDNWSLEGGKLLTRRGYTPWATGLGAPVETLLPYSPPAGAPQGFAAAGGNIYDVTNMGVVGAPVVTGMTNARWQMVQMGTPGGQFLLAFNGADAPRLYDGTTWSVSAITGPNPAGIIWGNLHQRRLWVGEANSLTGWYLGTNAIMGAASPFSLAAAVNLGGYIMAMATWTRDGGSGVDDLAVFITSEGEVVVYGGTDPANAATWALQGVFRIGRPIGRRCFEKVGGDLIILTEEGAAPLSRVLPVDRAVQPRAQLTNRIDQAFNESFRLAGDLYGWDALVYPRGEALICNIPQLGGAYHQYVFNVATGAAVRWTGQPAVTWGLINGLLFFGTPDGRVCLADWGANDEGRPILADGYQAFSMLGTQSPKRFKRAEAIIEANGVPNVALDLGTDYEPPAALLPFTSGVTRSPAAVWDRARWDQSTWAPARVIWRGWRGVRGQGRAVSVRLRAQSSTVRVSWTATQYEYVTGGPL